MDTERDFIYVDDVVDAMIKLSISKQLTERIFNIGAAKSYRIDEVANIVLSFVGEEKKNLVFDAERIKTSMEDVQKCQADIKRIKEAIDWKPSCTIREGLEKTFTWYSTFGFLEKDKL